MPSRGRTAAPAGRKPAPRPIKGEVLMDEKTARRVRRTRWRRLLTTLAVVSIVGGVIGLYLSPLLRVQHVEVVGPTGVAESEVAALARLDGRSMMRLDLEAAERRLESLPLVASATLERRWPDTVRITITERAPWALWEAAGARYVIDSEGVVLAQDAPLENAPLIRDLSATAQLAPGNHVDRDAVVLAQALLQRVPEALAIAVASLEYSAQQGLAVTTDAGYRVVIGDSQNVDYKLAVWKAIEEELGREAMAGHVLDLRFGDRPSFQ